MKGEKNVIICTFNLGSSLVNHIIIIYFLYSLGWIFLRKSNMEQLFENENKPSACDVFMNEMEIENGLMFE